MATVNVNSGTSCGGGNVTWGHPVVFLTGILKNVKVIRTKYGKLARPEGAQGDTASPYFSTRMANNINVIWSPQREKDFRTKDA